MDNFDLGASGSCSGIYCFENLLDGKRYVGKADCFSRRKSTHFCVLNSKNHNDSKYFQAAWNKYGKENFRLWTVEECAIELLNKREIFWIVKLRSHYTEWGYNLTYGGSGTLGYKHSKETIQKLRVAKLGKHLFPETIQKMKDVTSGINNPNILKKEKVQQIKDMLDVEISGYKIAEELNLGRHVVRKVKFGGYKNIYDIDGVMSRSDYSAIIKKEIVQQAKHMLDNKISQSQIAKKLKISRITVCKVKNGWYKDIYGI